MVKRRLNLDLKPKIRKIEIYTKGLVKTEYIGEHSSLFKGHGLEFESFRDYTPNDDSKLIDWKASLRSNKLLIKERVPERNLNIFFLIDVSSSMVFGSTKKLKIEYVAEMVHSLAYAILETENSVGFALFNDKIVAKLMPSFSKVQTLLIAKILKNPDIYGGNFDLKPAIDFLPSFLPFGSMVIIVSDFIGLKKGWEEPLKISAKRYDIVAFMVRDPRDRRLPKGVDQVMISDPYSEKEVVMDPDLIREEYERYVNEQERRIKQLLLDSEVDIVKLTTDKSFVGPILDFFKRRQRIWK